MIDDSQAFSGFSVHDLAAAKQFYGDTLGLETSEQPGPMALLWLHLRSGAKVLLYPKDNHEPASFTVLSFPAPDVEKAVADLTASGIAFEHYEGTPLETDEHGIFRGGGPLIAWFKDPSGNILAVLQADAEQS
jgi:predicted enzyme related to lactoylglutathione lyase